MQTHAATATMISFQIVVFIVVAFAGSVLTTQDIQKYRQFHDMVLSDATVTTTDRVSAVVV